MCVSFLFAFFYIFLLRVKDGSVGKKVMAECECVGDWGEGDGRTCDGGVR